MNAKQKRKLRRDAEFRSLEKLAAAQDARSSNRDYDMEGVKSAEKMNDHCPYMYDKCGHPRQEYNFDCFGKYQMCQYKQALDNGLQKHDSKRRI